MFISDSEVRRERLRANGSRREKVLERCTQVSRSA